MPIKPLRTNSTQYTVYDFLQAWKRKSIRVNKKYQRSDQVWRDTARSYLVETVLLNYPIPKLALHLVDDGQHEPYKDIVDGQQRSAALRDFFNNKFPLADVVERTELIGKYYKTLIPSQQRQFRTYQLGVDEFLDADDNQIREVFRRINSYTVPLNAEEQRHAEFQGRFKWFINKLRPECGSVLINLGTLSEHAVIRMGDAKLLAEVCHAVINGIHSARKDDLKEMYEAYENHLPEGLGLDKRLRAAFQVLSQWTWLAETVLIEKQFQVYSLLLAIMHAQQAVPTLNNLRHRSRDTSIDDSAAKTSILRLDRALLAGEDADKKYQAFVEASAKGTNGKGHREQRFTFYFDAITRSNP